MTSIKTKILVLIRLRCTAKVSKPNKYAPSTKRLGNTDLDKLVSFTNVLTIFALMS